MSLLSDTGAHPAHRCQHDGWTPHGGLLILLEGGGEVILTRAALDMAGWAGQTPTTILRELAEAGTVTFIVPADLPPAPVWRGKPPLASMLTWGRA
jgi:hypothetical protein